MFNPSKLALPMAILAISAAGCTEGVAPLERVATLENGPLLAANNTNPNGATIVRFANIEFLVIFDAERQLLSAHMPSNICGAGEFNTIEVMRVRTPSEVNSVFARITDDEQQVAVYSATSPQDAGFSVQPIDFLGFGELVDVNKFCAFLAGPTRIAEGTVQRMSTFSAASFHLRLEGTIQGVDGLSYHLTELYHLNADAHDPNNPATFVQQLAEVRLSPRP
ncbi:MAG: hypothetical protein WD825_05145 [Gemmatimonadaceae bacterium]